MGAKQSKPEEPSYKDTEQKFLKQKEKQQKLLQTPWRKRQAEWDLEYSNMLSAEIRLFHINIGTRGRREMERVTANLLFLGPVGAGKSAFINSVMSISSGRLVSRATTAGYNRGTSTLKYISYYPDGEVDNVRLHDTAGLMEEVDQGLNLQNLIPMIEGHIKDGYEFENKRGIMKTDRYYCQSSTRKDKITCVVFVVDASTLDTLAEKHTRKIRELEDILITKEIPQVLILTKCDRLCELVCKNTEAIFNSKLIKACVNYAASKFRIQQSVIHPVVNYGNSLDSELDAKISIPILLALRQMVYFAGDYLEKQEQRERARQGDEI